MPPFCESGEYFAVSLLPGATFVTSETFPGEANG
jgi:hypothetical protein